MANIKTYVTDFDALSKAAEDENFCVVCLSVRTDVPVEYNCCYECGGGEISKTQLH